MKAHKRLLYLKPESKLQPQCKSGAKVKRETVKVL